MNPLKPAQEPEQEQAAKDEPTNSTPKEGLTRERRGPGLPLTQVEELPAPKSVGSDGSWKQF